MVGQRQPTVIKPSRSDEVVDPDEQLRIADEVKARFESMAPKRPAKPNRSEPDHDASFGHKGAVGLGPTPEIERLHSLKSQAQTVISAGGEGEVQEEFVETQYYKELVSIDKQHHTTGTGFIKVTKEGFEKELQRLSENGTERKQAPVYGIKNNPATNDWTPNLENVDQVAYISSKPSRSG